ncbi:RHS repeat protein [Myxococcus hansupus]|nr:RHS repeat protein [Myxococcus hansupus]
MRPSVSFLGMVFLLLPAGAVAQSLCLPGSDCCGSEPRSQTVTEPSAGRGNGQESPAAFSRVYTSLPGPEAGGVPRVYQAVDSCAVAGACSPGSVRHEWACATETSPAYERAAKNKRDAWEVYVHTPPATGTGASAMTLEKTSVLRGAQDMTGTGALSEDFFTYSYGPGGQQQLASIEKASLLGGAGERARTFHRYNASGRRVATIQSGWTWDMDRSTMAWTSPKRFIGTFYFVQRTGDATPDPLGRVLEVHGPCWVESEAATDCPAASAAPLTQYFYWADSETTSFRKNRLMRESRFPAGAASTPLVTQFNAYDVAGNVTERVDASGVTTVMAWEGPRLTSQAVRTPGQVDVVTRFGHDAGRLSWVQHPEGNYEVFCYRTGTPSGACSGGTSTELLQWKARAADMAGASWSEKVTFTYWPDGSLKEERFLEAPGVARRVRSFAADAHLRPTHERWGVGPGSYTRARSFDGADNLTGVGHAFNAPPAWCAVAPNGHPASPACAALTYDRANRLERMDEFPSEGQGQRTLLRYDTHGNIQSLKAGCLGGDTFETCTQPASAFTYDDFGNLVGATASHLKGPVRYAFDAFGNKAVELGPLAERPLLYTYDHLSRLVMTQAQYVGLDSPFTHYQLGYDNEGTPPPGCETQLNSLGRLRYSEDSFGRTWYQYDTLGRVIREMRVRANATGCGQGIDLNPDTHYRYTPNGNLASITYPHGRVVTYVYGGGARTDRISAVDVTSHDGTEWHTQRIISSVLWEPYGGLRGYQQHHLRSDVLRSVEYMLGDDASVAPASSVAACAETPPSMATADLTGRIRALRVSTGSMSPGLGAGDVYSRTYTWNADLVRRMDTCLLRSETAQTEEFTYDRALRLKSAMRPTGNTAASGGAYSSLAYTYDRRGNRSGTTEAGHLGTTIYYEGVAPDHLLVTYSGPGPAFAENFGYHANGSVDRKSTNRLTQGDGFSHLNLYPSNEIRHAHMRSMSLGWEALNYAYYVYFHDAFDRRRLKDYPTGVRDEYFHDVRGQLLSDRGNDRILAPVNYYIEDDYVWLGGRPVAVARGKFTPQWTRLSDASSECSRNADPAACGLYFIVTDPTGRPVVMLDADGRVTGTGEYSPLGHVNRVNHYAMSANPYADGLDEELTRFQQPARSSTLKLQQRVLFSLIDTEPTHDYVYVKDGSTGAQLAGPYSGVNRGMLWSDWVEATNGEVAIQFVSNTTCDEATCGADAGVPPTCTCPGSARKRGVAIPAYEYRRFESGASPFWTLLRRVGQYYDTETDLFDDGLRSYDPNVGRYFEPDPRVLDPEFIVWNALQGRSVGPYLFAQNNPLRSLPTEDAPQPRVGFPRGTPRSSQPVPGASLGAQPGHDVELIPALARDGASWQTPGTTR